ncbi:cytochrome P450 [Streptomyces sp. NPDC014986]|uniref:cytochrome P450 n=1 Tax=Streptomyces sp. NPDC014986 TaxID=3364934 RepID=UPI0036FA5070
MRVSTAPSADRVTLEQLTEDPYTVYDRLRAVGPVVWAPQLDRFLVTGLDDCRFVEANEDLFEIEQEDSVLKRAMGEVMLSKNGPEHGVERAAVNPALRPKVIAEVWRAHFEANAARVLERFRRLGPGADINADFALPYAAMNLAVVVGLPDVPWSAVQRWSLAFIAEVANVRGDPRVSEANDIANAEADAAIDQRIAELIGSADPSMISMMLRAGLPPDLVRANAKLAISGGVNEPQHVLTSGVHALSRHPDQLAAVHAGEYTFAQVFDEVVRWMPPIHTLMRRARVDVELNGVTVPAGSLVWILLGAANRDPHHFDRPDQFMVSRLRKPHLAFGSGPHICAGSWAARSSIAEVAWPLLYDELPGLAPVDDDARFHGFFFRGLPGLPVTWNIESDK